MMYLPEGPATPLFPGGPMAPGGPGGPIVVLPATDIVTTSFAQPLFMCSINRGNEQFVGKHDIIIYGGENTHSQLLSVGIVNLPLHRQRHFRVQSITNFSSN